jgi:septum formation protein
MGLEFIVEPSGLVENPEDNGDPNQLAQRLSQAKAHEVAAHHRNAIVIGADTLGVLDGKLLRKPRTEGQARDMLQSMSGRRHIVITGFTIIDTGSGKAVTQSVETNVWLKHLTPGEIEAYVMTGEPMDKAGAYAIQGLGAALVERIEGDYFNVMGLPVAAVAVALNEYGIELPPHNEWRSQ